MGPVYGILGCATEEAQDQNKAILAQNDEELAQIYKEFAQKDKELAQKDKELKSQTQAYLDDMLREIVTANYTPTIFDQVPGQDRGYISRQQDDALRKSVRDNIDGVTHGFLMLVGESGSGKTTLMQNLLKNEYKEGVLELSLSAETLINRSVTHGKSFIDQIKEGVWEKFAECATHPKRHRNFLDFVKHANNIRKKARGEDAHPLIIYIALESKKDLKYDTMMEFAGAFGSVATMLSSKAKSCKTIVEFSKSAISDDIKRLRGSDQIDFEVNAMTEDEFLKIGKQVLKVSNDDRNLVDQYLKYYHDWLGGHTKTLTDLSKSAKIASMLVKGGGGKSAEKCGKSANQPPPKIFPAL